MRKGQIAGVTLTAMMAAAIVLAACSDNSSAPVASPAAGLSKIEANDTSSTSPPSPGEVQPGSFHGVIYGLAPSGSGPDTMANSVKLQGVRVAAYPYLLEINPDGSPKAGPEEAFALTNADGVFQLPTLKGGEYVVTITPQPPNDATWIGGWTVATAYAHSNDNGWWIYLPRK